MYKKIILFLILILSITCSFAFAEEINNVTISVEGQAKEGNEIIINVNIDNLESFFAGLAKLEYNNEILKVTKIEPGELIKSEEIQKFEASNNIDNENGVLQYAFTCLGDIKGYKGAGTFIRIHAEVLKEEEFIIKSKPFLKDVDDEYNLKLQICKNENGIKELAYNFTSVPIVNAVKADNGNINSAKNIKEEETKEVKKDKETENKIPENNPENNPDNATQNNENKTNQQELQQPPKLNITQNQVSTIDSIEKKNDNKLVITLTVLVMLLGVTGIVIYRKNKR